VSRIHEIGSRKEGGDCSPKIAKCELATCEEGIRTVRSWRAWTVDMGQAEFMKSKVGRKEDVSLQNHETRSPNSRERIWTVGAQEDLDR
jgi:hypothetical protein